jgi:hypothetical protein
MIIKIGKHLLDKQWDMWVTDYNNSYGTREKYVAINIDDPDAYSCIEI